MTQRDSRGRFTSDVSPTYRASADVMMDDIERDVLVGKDIETSGLIRERHNPNPDSKIVTGYMRGAFKVGGMQEIVPQVVRTIRGSKLEFGAIVVTGVSGLVIGAPVAYELGKPLVVVRKDDDNSHAGGGFVEGLSEYHVDYIIIDDFISSGATLARVVDKIDDAREDWRPVGVFLWSRDYEPEMQVIRRRMDGYEDRSTRCMVYGAGPNPW